MSDDLSLAGNPLFWFRAYGGLTNHYFVWMVAHGALDDIDPITRCERWTQPPLLPGVEAIEAPPAPRRNVYRSRRPNEHDVPYWNRATLRALPTRPRLSRERVLG